MNYNQVEDWLCNQLPFFYKEGSAAYKKDLKNIKLLLSHLGSPHKKNKFIHVAGTNGKGSVCHILSSVLQDSGYKVGLFTSPHILDFRERIKINGKKIEKEFISSFVNKDFDLYKKIPFSFFEITTAMSFQYFSEEKVDIAIIECGLGGRLDSTNIINPILSVITNVSLDHVNILGDNIISIAQEKAGIIKDGVPILTSEKKIKILNILKEKAFQKKAPFHVTKDFDLNIFSPRFSNFQLENICTVKSVTDILNEMNFNIPINSFYLGVDNLSQNTGLIGRWDIVCDQPLVILDIAHNEAAINLVMSQLANMSQKKHIILGFSSEKDLDKIFKQINIDATYYFCASKNNRVLDPKNYIESIKSLNFNYKIYKNSLSAFNYIKSIIDKNEMVLVTGSSFIVSDVAVNFR